MQGSVTICLATVTDENVYTTQAFEAHLCVKVGAVWEAGSEQQLNDDSSLLNLHLTTLKDHGRHYSF